MNEDCSPLVRREGESDVDYHRRLVYGKLDDKSLADYDYTELSKYVYGQDYSCDVARRMMYGSCRTLKLLDESRLRGITDADILAEIDAKTKELQKESRRFYDQRREYNKLITEDSRGEYLYSVIEGAASKLPDTIGNVFDGMCRIEPSDSEAILVFTDWHYGMLTNNLFNKYDTEICRRRVANVVSNAIVKLETHGCRKLTILVLGDLIHGAINVSARVASEELVCDQLMQVSEVLAQAISILASCVESVDVYTTYGNHARITANKKESIHRDNLERLVPWWLELRLAKYDNITIHTDNGTETLLFSVCGHDMVAAHGDIDSVRSSPRMFSTLMQKKMGANVEYVLLGDKHHRESFDELGCTAIICGSLCGADNYASDKRLYSTPEQLLLIVNDKDGVDAEYHIKCE